MAESDKKGFLVLLAWLSDAYKEEISKERAKIYYEFLKEYSLEQLKGAFHTCIVDCRFFPKVSEILERLKNPIDPKSLPDYWPYLTQIEHKEKPLNRDEAKIFLQKIFDYVSKNSDELRAAELQERKERFEQRRMELKRQAKLLK